MVENIATIANIANPQILSLLTEIKGKTWNINKLLKIKFLHSSPGFGTMNRIKGLTQNLSWPFFHFWALGQRFGQHFSKNLQIG